MEMLFEPKEFSFSAFYQGTVPLYFCELVEAKLMHSSSIIPIKMRQQLMISLRTIIRFRFHQQMTDPVITQKLQTAEWFSIQIRHGELEPRVYPEAISSFELVPICYPVLMSAQACLQSNRGKYWKLELKGVFFLEYSIGSPGAVSQRSGSSGSGNYMDRSILSCPSIVKDIICRAVEDCPLFSGYTTYEDFQQLLSRFEFYHANAGDIVIRKGDIGDYFYVIESGLLSVVFDLYDRINTTKREKLSAGQFFGEVALQHQTIRGCSIIADIDCALWRISARDIRQDIAISVMDDVCRTYVLLCCFVLCCVVLCCVVLCCVVLCCVVLCLFYFVSHQYYMFVYAI